MARPSFSKRFSTLALVVLAFGLGGTPVERAFAQSPFSARTGVDVAASAAQSWAADARLIYLENDEPIDANGQANRWGYLYYSASLDELRGYSVENGKVVQAANLGLRFDAPFVSADWVDSHEAVRLAEEKAGAKFRTKHAGAIQNMVLMRSAIELDQPDRTNWMVLYTAEGVPSLFVVIDAVTGKVSRTWRG